MLKHKKYQQNYLLTSDDMAQLGLNTLGLGLASMAQGFKNMKAHSTLHCLTGPIEMILVDSAKLQHVSH